MHSQNAIVVAIRVACSISPNGSKESAAAGLIGYPLGLAGETGELPPPNNLT